MTSKHGVSSHSNLITEVSRKNIIGKNKSMNPARYNRRLDYRVTQAGSIDESRLVNEDIIVAKVPVGDYICTVAFKNVIKNLLDVLKSQPKPNVNLQSVIRAVNRAIDDSDILVDCSCPDFCLHEDTKIKLLNGKVVTIKEMKSMFDNNEELWVYSTDENGDFKPGKVTDVWISGSSSELIKIILDNDKEIITTPNHRYMIRNGSYVEARDLHIGQSLMPLYFRYQDGYENVMLNSKPKAFVSVYKTVANELLQNEINEAYSRSGEDIISIHHSDYNKLNNYPSNLKPMGKIEHWRFHANHAMEDKERFRNFTEAGHEYWRTPEGRERKSKEFSESLKRFHDSMSEEERIAFNVYCHEWMHTEEGHLIMSNGLKNYWANLDNETKDKRNKQNGIKLNGENGEKASARIKSYWENLSDEEYERRCKQNSINASHTKGIKKPKEFCDTISRKQKEFNSKLTAEERKERCSHLNTPESKRNCALSKMKKTIDLIVSMKIDLNESNYYKYKKTNYPRVSSLFNNFDEAVSYFGLSSYNHKVKSIEIIKLEESVPVYDLTVDKYNNFFVDAGVILHNCYRMAYWATRYGIKFGKPETRPSKITNPKDKLGATCKHLSALLSNKRWLIKLASVINEVIKKRADDIREKYNLEPDEFIINVSGRPSTKTKRNLRMANVKDKTSDTSNEDEVDSSEDGGDEELIPKNPFAIKGGTLDGSID